MKFYCHKSNKLHYPFPSNQAKGIHDCPLNKVGTCGNCEHGVELSDDEGKVIDSLNRYRFQGVRLKYLDEMIPAIRLFYRGIVVVESEPGNNELVVSFRSVWERIERNGS